MNLPAIKNALQNIKNTCSTRLYELYPKGLPDDIHTRYTKELSYLEHSNLIDDFEIFRCLSEEAQKCSTIISMRGTIMGSFIYFLLGKNCFNPLPVYYYCKECGYYERIDTHLFGIDFSQKSCPNCKNLMWADGFNLSIESVWGIHGERENFLTFDYNITKEFLPFARRILQTLYPENTIAPWGMFQIDSNAQSPFPDDQAIGISLSGYVILPTEHNLEDYPDLLSYLENGDPCLTGSNWELEQSMLKPIRLFSSHYIEQLISLQRSTGIYANEITPNDLREITWSNLFNSTILNSTTSLFFHELRPKTFKDMVSIEASSHSTFSWQDGNQKLFSDYKNMIQSECFKKYPCYTCEDFFDYLVEAGVNRELAFTVSEKIRKGHANSSGKLKEEFFELPIPEEIKEVAKNYMYVFPQAHCIEYMLIYAKLSYYAKIDSCAFSRIIFKKSTP